MKTLEQHLADWDAEEALEKAGIHPLGDPKFVLKHALRLQGLFMEKDGMIYDSKGKFYASLGSAKWNGNIIEAQIKLATAVDFVKVTLDIGKLK